MEYFLSLCCVVKDERYIKEFIIYHIIQGVEKFYIYDNESKKPLKEYLHEPIFKKFCEIINYPGKCKQLDVYRDCIQRTKFKSKWLIIIDADEFILPHKHNTVRSFLNDYKDYHAIGINWVMFGSNNHSKKKNGFLIKYYTKCCREVDQHIKTICRPEYVLDVPNPHYVIIADKNKYIDPDKNIISGPFNKLRKNNIIQINHYWGKSLEEYLEKVEKGCADTLEKRTVIPNYIELFNEKVDKTIKNKYIHHIKKLFNENNIDHEFF
tara:strand:- start:929 stop:1726 length:798 start_codon:yes stop_codon:yes gene_type:complete